MVQHSFSTKQSNYIKHGTSSRTNNLSVKDTNNLYEGAFANDHEKFWGANEQLFCKTPKEYQRLPIRLIVSGKMQLVAVFPCSENSKNEEQVDENQNQNQNQNQKQSEGGKTFGQFLEEQFQEKLDKNENFLVQGVFPPLDVPLVWLYEHFSHPDNFLYIIQV